MVLVWLFWPRRIVCHISSAPKARADIASIVCALNEFAIDHDGRYPDSLVLLVTPDADGKRYLTCKAVPRDPWKNEYHYEPPSAGSSELLPHVWSYGKDGGPDGDDDIDSRTMNDE
ncbi:MAG: type II secretion system protein GspG [Planctomycetes bacterium]|nr:type II secretion system protein GspG [Planctomycetota bacterium]